MAGGKPNPIDVHVGARVRLRRMLLGISQEKLGAGMGLTFQQVQKYEKGVNRIGASRLFQISELLDVPIQSVCGRVRELVVGKAIKDSGRRRPTKSGRKATVWEAA